MKENVPNNQTLDPRRRGDDIVLVDKQDQQVGTTDKLTAHKNALLHRAFSVLIFRQIPPSLVPECTQNTLPSPLAGEGLGVRGNLQVLIQQRNPEKYHCGGLWTNTCCSHPRPNETTGQAALRRLQEECGFEAELTHAGEFIYQAPFDNGLTEHEYDHVFTGWYDGDITQFDRDEISELKWIALNDLESQLKTNSQQFTPWFAQAFAIALEIIK